MAANAVTSVWDVVTFVCGPVYDCVRQRHGLATAGDEYANACLAAARGRDVAAFTAPAFALSALLIDRSEVLRVEAGSGGVPVVLIGVSQSLVRCTATMAGTQDPEADAGFATEIAVLLAGGGAVAATIRFVADGTSIRRAIEATALLDTPAV